MMNGSKKSGNLFYLGFFLCCVCAAATAIMGFAALWTKGPIAQAQAKKISQALRQVLPEFDNDILSEVDTVSGVRFYTARKKGEAVGCAAELSVSSGYGWAVNALIGFYPDGRIRTFVITQHSETPGLGSVVMERVIPRKLSSLFTKEKKVSGSEKGLAPNPILDQYAGHTLYGKDSWRKPWLLTKDGGDVQYVTGATISSRAVNLLAWKAAEAFGKFKEQSRSLRKKEGK